MDEYLFLRPNILVEPLVNNWYAWPHLVSPATAALNITGKQLEMLESYLKAPHLHRAAVKNPAMRGGPFIDIDESKTEAIRALLHSSKTRVAKLFEFAAAVKQLDTLLIENATGYSMQPLYEKIPAALQGYVELVYDLHNRPGFRFFEALLYESPYYMESLQSISLSEINADKDRSFILSTPRVEDEGNVFLHMPFASKKLDELFKMKKKGGPLAYIENLLGIAPENKKLFNTFFTDNAPPPRVLPPHGTIRVRFFGHACLLIEYNNSSILIDPVISYEYESNIRRNTYNDLPDEIDFVLITHNHFDHILLETMLQIRHKVKNIIIARNMDGLLQDPSLKLMLTKLGFKNVREISELERVVFDEGFIMGVPFIGEHNDILMHSKLCYHICIGGRKILAMADSCNISPALYEKVHRITGDMDALFIGMECDGAPASFFYGPLMPGKTDYKKDRSRLARGCDFDECYDLVKRFNCKHVYVYAMGLEPWLRYILNFEYKGDSNPIIQSDKLVATCLNEGLTAERLFAEKEITF